MGEIVLGRVGRPEPGKGGRRVFDGWEGTGRGPSKPAQLGTGLPLGDVCWWVGGARR